MQLSIRITIVLALFVWVTGIFIEWIVPLIPNFAISVPFFQNAYSLVCHQQQPKLLGESLYHSLVCARCSGIYIGFFISSLLSLVLIFPKEPQIKFLLISAIPMMTDVILYSLGFYSYSKTLALFTGLLLGSTGFLYFYSALIKLFQEINQKKK